LCIVEEVFAWLKRCWLIKGDGGADLLSVRELIWRAVERSGFRPSAPTDHKILLYHQTVFQFDLSPKVVFYLFPTTPMAQSQITVKRQQGVYGPLSTRLIRLGVDRFPLIFRLDRITAAIHELQEQSSAASPEDRRYRARDGGA
jgi:hypothetical protein